MLQDFVNAIISAKNAITGTPPKSQQTQGMPLTQLPGANPVSVPTQNANPVEDIGNAIAGGINDVAGVVGKIPLNPIASVTGIGKPINLGQAYQNVTGNTFGMGPIVPQGKITAAELPMLAAGVLQQVAEPGSPEADTEDVAEEPQTFGETPTRASYIPPSKFNPPPEETPLKVNEPVSPEPIHGPAAPEPNIGSESPNAGKPFSGENKVPPSGASETPVVEPSPNSERTFSPIDLSTKDLETANAERNIKIDGKDIRSPDEKAQVNATLNGYGIKGTQTEQLQQSVDTRNALGEFATKTIEAEGGTTKYSNLLDMTTKRLANSKVRIGVSTIPTEGAANDYLTDVYNRAAETTGQSPPTEIPDSIVFKMKQEMNKDAMSTFGQPDNTKWSSGQTISRYSRDVFDNVIDAAHPNVAKMNNDMSDLYKAEDSLRTGANSEGTEAQKVATAPQPSFVQKVGNWAKNNPIIAGAGLIGLDKYLPDIAKGAVGLVSTGLSELPKLPDQIANSLGYEKKGINNQNGQGGVVDKFHNGSITSGSNISNSPYSSIQPDPTTGKIELSQTPDPTQRQYMSQNDYNNQLAKLGQTETGSPYYTTDKATLDARFQGDQSQAEQVFTGNNIKNFMDNATTYNSDGKTLFNTLASLPTSFWNGVGSAGSIKAYVDPAFTQQLQEMANFNQEFASAYKSVTGQDPTDDQLLSSTNSPKSAYMKYLSMMQFIAGTYKKYLSPYLALTSETGTQNQQGYSGSLPSTPQPFPQPTPTTSQLPANMLQSPLQALPIQ